MSSTHYTIPEITTRLEQVRDDLIAIVEAMPDDRFFAESETEWSAAGYLKHLILGVKAFAKGLSFPPEQLEKLFGKSETPSRGYEEFVEAYNHVIAAGARAEMVPSLLPVGYRMPEGVTDERAYLLDTWRDANQRIISALESWREETLDQYQMPHPAVGSATLREMLYFTLHHNRLHTNDIARRGEVAV